MFLDDVPINYTGILLAAIVYFVLGIIWYAPNVFGNRWKHEVEKSEGSFKQPEQVRSTSNQIGAYIGEFIISLIIAYILSLFIQISQADEIIEGIIVALWIWIGFIATTHFSAVLWGRKSVKNFFIHAGFMLLGLIAMGVAIIYVGFVV